MSKRIHWLCVHPTPYHDSLFSAIAQSGHFDLVIHYKEELRSSHPWKSRIATGDNYSFRVFEQRFGFDRQILWLALTEKDSIFVMAGWNDITSILMFIVLMVTGRSYLVWTDTPNLTKERSLGKAWLRRLWLNLVFNHSNGVMGTGQLALKSLQKMGCSSEKLINFPYYIDTEFFSPRKRSAHSGRIVIVSSGRLIDRKGYEVAIRAFATAKNRTKFDSFRYRIAGEGLCREQLQALVDKLGLQKNIEFVGWLEPDQILNFYQESDVFLHPALEEPYGVVILEAMACGLAVVGSDTTGAVRDRVQSGVNGFIHQAGNVDDLANILEYIFAQPTILEEMGKAARHTAEEWPLAHAVGTLSRILYVK